MTPSTSPTLVGSTRTRSRRTCPPDPFRPFDPNFEQPIRGGDGALSGGGTHSFFGDMFLLEEWAGLEMNFTLVSGTAQSQADPCAGTNASSLDYAARNGEKHLTDRHIRTDINPDASKYVFDFPINTSQATKFAQVQALNAATFQLATGYRQRNGNVAYVYAFPKIPTILGNITVVVGKDRDHNFEYTNVNTLIVYRDCKSVVTSFPGFPPDFSTNPNAQMTGTERRFNSIYAIPPHN